MTGGGKGGGGKKKVQRVCDVICKRPHKKYDSTPIILYLLIFFLLRIRKLFLPQQLSMDSGNKYCNSGWLIGA